MPTDAILPHLVYSDVAAAIDWLGKAFGFVEHYRYGPPDSPQGAQMHQGDAWIMLTSAREGRSAPAQIGSWTQTLTIFVDDVDGHFAKTKSMGARIIEEPNQPFYGERQYVAEDPEGHRWTVSCHVRDVAPEEWGAHVKAG